MFCETCGASLPAGAQVCSACGRRLVQAGVPGGEGRVARHVRLLGILWIAYGALKLSAAALFYFSSQVLFSLLRFDWGVERFLAVAATAVASALLFKAALCFIAGWGLLERQSWGRIFALILGFLALLVPPFGTALGVFTLWVLLPERSEREYRTLVHAA